MSTPSLAELLDVALEAAYLGGRRTLAYFNAGVAVETKADDTPVTRADREAEEVIRAEILRRYPQHAVVGEELGEQAGDVRYRWIVDPIDGTKSFIHGAPLYATLIGVEVEGEAAVGVIHLPALGETVAAARGLGCRWNGRPCRVSDVKRLEDATLLTSDARMAQARSDAYDRLAARAKVVRTWGDAFGYALVATGRAEVMLDPAMHPWDSAPLLPILQEAGGRFATWEGEATIWGPDAFAANAALYGEVLSVLRTEQRRA
ncbi:MAG: inositol monophosphatase family protein [Planctomycetota bacterium]|nr:inositol monophosphatase family protein [Planctomycetota bacterium]